MKYWNRTRTAAARYRRISLTVFREKSVFYDSMFSRILHDRSRNTYSLIYSRNVRIKQTFLSNLSTRLCDAPVRGCVFAFEISLTMSWGRKFLFCCMEYVDTCAPFCVREEMEIKRYEFDACSYECASKRICVTHFWAGIKKVHIWTVMVQWFLNFFSCIWFC